MRRVRVTVVSTRIKRVQTTMRRGHESVESSGSQEERCSECEKNHERASLKRVGARGETAEVKEKKSKEKDGEQTVSEQPIQVWSERTERQKARRQGQRVDSCRCNAVVRCERADSHSQASR